MEAPPAPCRPFTLCWCESNPTHPRCETVSLNINELPLLIIAIVWIAYLTKRFKK